MVMFVLDWMDVLGSLNTLLMNEILKKELKVIFLVNKIDTIPEEMNFSKIQILIKSQISEITGIKEPKILFVSARDYDGLRDLTSLIIENSKTIRD